MRYSRRSSVNYELSGEIECRMQLARLGPSERRICSPVCAFGVHVEHLLRVRVPVLSNYRSSNDEFKETDFSRDCVSEPSPATELSTVSFLCTRFRLCAKVSTLKAIQFGEFRTSRWISLVAPPTRSQLAKIAQSTAQQSTTQLRLCCVVRRLRGSNR